MTIFNQEREFGECRNSSDDDMIAFNVFHTREKGIYCAVPEDQPVPAFIAGEGWEFIDKIPDDQLPRDAPEGIRFNGFFIFHPFEKEKLAA